MNWIVWTAFIVIVAATAALGALAFIPNQGGMVEQTSERVTDIYVALEQPYEGTVTVTYPEEGAPEETCWRWSPPGGIFTSFWTSITSRTRTPATSESGGAEGRSR